MTSVCRLHDQPYQSRHKDIDGSLEDVEPITGGEFYGLTSFASLPYLPYFKDLPEDQKYDIAFLGAPFDAVSRINYCALLCTHLPYLSQSYRLLTLLEGIVDGRPGARFGPTGIRLGSRRIHPDFGYTCTCSWQCD